MEADRVQIKTLAICLTAVIAVEAVLRVGLRPGAYNPIIVLGAVRLLQAGLIIIIVSIREKGLSSIGLSLTKTLPGLKRGLTWSAGFGLITLLGFALIFAIGLNPLTLIHTHLPAKPGDIALFFLVGGLIGPVAEEVFFRGVLYGFCRRWGAPAAIILSTIAFVLAHPVFPGVPVTQIVGGLLFAVAYEVEKNLIVPITIHV
ncbi:MAG: CPBP family intramembrane metalloprotease, partial [Desulfobacteraceae bacterium]|nr:CPBP family intramembrane metalloprotease [Desulfobacteraceae bacterium]